MTQTLTPPDLAAYLATWHAERASREEQRRAPDGYLSYAGFHKLGTVAARFDGIPGRWSAGADGPVVELDAGEELVVDGAAVSGTHGFGPVREREFRRAARTGDVILELSTRGGVSLLRPIDPAAGRRRIDSYSHTPAYEPDPRWILEGRFVPFPELRPAPFDATIGGIVHVHATVGEVVVTIDGVEERLLVTARDDQQAGTAGTGTILFTDATATTDPKGRSLPVDFPAQEGPVTLDFNHARNIQRPYTPFAPCPVAPARNRVTAAIEAGEQLPVFTA